MFDAAWAFLIAQLSNSFFSGGLALGLFGGVAAAASRLPRLIRFLADDQLMTSVTVDDRSDLFRQVVAWLASHRYTDKCRRLQAQRRRDEDGIRHLQLGPTVGIHFLLERRVPLWITRHLDGGRGSNLTTGNQPRETITIKAFTRDQTFVRGLLERIVREFADDDVNRTSIYTNDEYADWNCVSKLFKRPLASVILPDGLSQSILDDLRVFLNDTNWYRQRGIPWRRGVLLWGPPGTGKTSLIQALTGELDLDLCIVNLTVSRLDDAGLSATLAAAPAKSVLLFEDIDGLFIGREPSNDLIKITFSGLLNAIDGVGAQEGRIVFMTTNHPERLDPALIRPGRVDREVELGLADATVAGRLVGTFFPDRADLADAVARKIGRGLISPAALQGHLLACREQPDEVLGLLDPDQIQISPRRRDAGYEIASANLRS